MTNAQIAAFVHPDALKNAPIAAAHRMMDRVARLGWHNLRYGFAPPRRVTLGVLPVEEGSTAEPLPIEALLSNGALNLTPLHYVLMIETWGGQLYGLNAGLLCWAFALGEREGYTVVREQLRGMAA